MFDDVNIILTITEKVEARGGYANWISQLTSDGTWGLGCDHSASFLIFEYMYCLINP